MESVTTDAPVSLSPRPTQPIDAAAAAQLTAEFDEADDSEFDAADDKALEKALDSEEISDAALMRVALDAAVEAIRPAIQMDGGDMIVHELRAEEGVVDIELVGACVGCPMSSITLKQGVERILTDRVPGLVKVRAKGIDYDVQDDIW